jgi:hypothetical protein
LLLTLQRELPRGKAQALLQALQINRGQPAARSFFSRFGGLFLLAPAILDLELHERLAHTPYPAMPGTDKPAWLLYSIALQCLGGNRLEQSRADPAPTLFAGLAAPLQASAIARHADRITPAMHESFGNQPHLPRTACRESASAPAAVSAKESSNAAKWLSLEGETAAIPNPALNTALQPVSAAVLRCFAGRLGALAPSSPEFLRRNFIESRAMIELLPDRIDVWFLTCPLQMVLRMAGFEHTSWTLPWLGGRRLTFHFEGGSRS